MAVTSQKRRPTPPTPPSSLPEGAVPCPGCRGWVYLLSPRRGLPPVHMRFVAMVFTPDQSGPGALVRAPAFARHDCLLLEDHLRRQAFKRAQERKEAEEIARGLRPPRLSPEEERQRQLEQAQRFACSKCGAQAGEPCLNLSKRAKGEEVPVRWPHPERFSLVLDASAESAYRERERQREQALVTAESFVCPKCSAEVGQRCVSLLDRKEGGGTFTRWPHGERQVLAESAAEEEVGEPSDSLPPVSAGERDGLALIRRLDQFG